ncbi:MAG: hypothetical protein AB8G95_30865 [Anaerolineae bacterium]
MSSSTTTKTIPSRKTLSRKRRPLTLWLGIGLIGFALLTLFYGGLAWFGFQAGDAEKVQKIASETEITLSRQIELAAQDASDNNFVLSQRRIDYILSVDPNNTSALALRDQIYQTQSLLLTPSPSPTPTETPTPPPTMTPTPLPPTPDPAEAIATREAAWEKVQADLETLDIEEQIQQLEVFRARYPGIYNRESSQQLYDRYVSRGTDLIRGNAVERGILLLTKARGLGDLPETLEGEIYWAEQYVAGVSYFAVNWELYLSYFRPLCDFSPYYQDSCGKLTEGLATAASEAFMASDWCTAARLYVELATVDPNAQLTDGNLSDRMNQTINSCGEPIALPPNANGTATPDDGNGTAPGAPLPQIP